MDSLNQNLDENKKNSSAESSPEEEERIRRNFLEELESLREKEKEILRKFGLKVKGDIPVSFKAEKEFDFHNSLDFFLKELADSEKQVYRQKGFFSQATIHQNCSQLRILKEKARTLLIKIETKEQDESQNFEEEWTPF